LNYSVGVARQFLQSGVIKNNKEIKKTLNNSLIIHLLQFIYVAAHFNIHVHLQISRCDYDSKFTDFIDTGKWKWPKNIHIIGTKIFSRESDIPGRSSRISYDWFDIRTQAMKDISILQEIHGRRRDIYISLRDCVISDEGDTKM